MEDDNPSPPAGAPSTRGLQDPGVRDIRRSRNVVASPNDRSLPGSRGHLRQRLLEPWPLATGSLLSTASFSPSTHHHGPRRPVTGRRMRRGHHSRHLARRRAQYKRRAVGVHGRHDDCRLLAAPPQRVDRCCLGTVGPGASCVAGKEGWSGHVGRMGHGRQGKVSANRPQRCSLTCPYQMSERGIGTQPPAELRRILALARHAYKSYTNRFLLVMHANHASTIEPLIEAACPPGIICGR